MGQEVHVVVTLDKEWGECTATVRAVFSSAYDAHQYIEKMHTTRYEETWINTVLMDPDAKEEKSEEKVPV